MNKALIPEPKTKPISNQEAAELVARYTVVREQLEAKILKVRYEFLHRLEKAEDSLNNSRYLSDVGCSEKVKSELVEKMETEKRQLLLIKAAIDDNPAPVIELRNFDREKALELMVELGLDEEVI